MLSKYSEKIASDIIRDGIGLEIHDSNHKCIVEIFRCDANCSIEINIFDDEVNFSMMKEYIKIAQSRLDVFENGRKLPDNFMSITDKVIIDILKEKKYIIS